MWYKKEKKDIRKATLKKHRRRIKLALKVGKEIPRFRKTEGWLTW